MNHRIKRIAFSALLAFVLMEAAAPAVANAQAEFLELKFGQRVMAPGDAIPFEVQYMTRFDTSRGECLGVDPPDIPLIMVNVGLFGYSGAELTGYLATACSGTYHTILNATYEVPLATPPGRYSVYVKLANGQLSSAPVEIEVKLSELTVTTASGCPSGPPGTEVTISGGVFKPGEEVDITWGEDLGVGTAIADSDGSISLRFEIPEGVEHPMEYTVYAIAMEGQGGASGRFLVRDGLTLSLTGNPRIPLSSAKYLNPEIRMALAGWEDELPAETAFGFVMDLRLKIEDSLGHAFDKTIKSVTIDGFELYYHAPDRCECGSDLEIVAFLASLLKKIPQEWWVSKGGDYREFLALKRPNVEGKEKDLCHVTKLSAPLSEPVIVRIEITRAELFFDDGDAVRRRPVALQDAQLEYELGQAITIAELADIKTWEKLTQPTSQQWRDFFFMFLPARFSATFHLVEHRPVAAIKDLLPWAMQFLLATDWHEMLLYPSSGAWPSAVCAKSFVEGLDYRHVEPFWLNYDTGDIVTIDKYGMIYDVEAAAMPAAVPYFYIVSASNDPMVEGEILHVPNTTAPFNSPWQGPQEDSQWIVGASRDSTLSSIYCNVMTVQGWIYFESTREGQCVLRPHSLISLELCRKGDVFAIPGATIAMGEITVWNEPITIGIGTLSLARVVEEPPRVLAYVKSNGTRYTVRVEENESFEVSVEEGSVDVLDVSGHLVDTVMVGESETYGFQLFSGQGDVNVPPTASFALMPQEPEAGDDIVVASKSSDPDSDLLTVSWYLNGEQLSEIGNQSDWEWENVEAGEHTLLLRVEDGKGGIDEHSVVVDVRAPGQESANRPPIASFALIPTDPKVGDPIVIVSTSSDPDGDPLMHTWYVNGEYEISAGDRSEWTWSSPGEGEYTIGLVVMDGEGGIGEHADTVTVVGDGRENARSASGGMNSLLYLLVIPVAAAVAIVIVRMRKRR